MDSKDGCLLYTSDAADEEDSVDLGGRRIIKKIFFKQKTAYEIHERLVGSEMCIRDRCSPGCPGTHSVDQAGLELRNPPASASRVLGLKVCATTPGSTCFLRQGLSLGWCSFNRLGSCLHLPRTGVTQLCS